MATDQERAIMAEIGLGRHYFWHQGSDCRRTRSLAAERLPDALSAALPPGALLHTELLQLVQEIAAWGEESPYYLTRTWVCASDVIAAHLDGLPESVVQAILERDRPYVEPRLRPDGSYSV